MCFPMGMPPASFSPQVCPEGFLALSVRCVTARKEPLLLFPAMLLVSVFSHLAGRAGWDGVGGDGMGPGGSRRR